MALHGNIAVAVAYLPRAQAFSLFLGSFKIFILPDVGLEKHTCN